MLEYWFPFSEIEETMRLGTWCDGIPLLTVEQIDRVTFFLSGVGNFPYQLAPFELEWHFVNRRDLKPASIVLRLGPVAQENQQTSRHNRNVEHVFRLRPKQNCDWMIAVELFDL